jgi:hypothetical protein
MSHASGAQDPRVTVLKHADPVGTTRNPMRTHTIFTVLTLLAAAPACDPNVDSGHQGEPLITLDGEVVKPDQAPTQDLDVVVAWVPFKISESFFVAQKAAIEGSFPASFTLDLYTAPDASMLSEFDENDPGFAIAFIMAVPAGTDLADFALEDDPPMAGVVETHVLVYAAGDLTADHDAVKYFFHEPVKQGFHLFEAVRKTEQEKQESDECQAQGGGDECGSPHDRLVPAPLDTSLVLKLGAREALDPPNIT